MAGRKSKAEGLGSFLNDQSWSGLEHKDLQVGVPGRMPLPHTKGLTNCYWFHDPEVLDITG